MPFPCRQTVFHSKTLRPGRQSARLSSRNVLNQSFFLLHEFFLLFSGSIDLFHAMDLWLRSFTVQVCRCSARPKLRCDPSTTEGSLHSFPPSSCNCGKCSGRRAEHQDSSQPRHLYGNPGKEIKRLKKDQVRFYSAPEEFQSEPRETAGKTAGHHSKARAYSGEDGSGGRADGRAGSPAIEGCIQQFVRISVQTAVDQRHLFKFQFHSLRFLILLRYTLYFDSLFPSEHCLIRRKGRARQQEEKFLFTKGSKLPKYANVFPELCRTNMYTQFHRRRRRKSLRFC